MTEQERMPWAARVGLDATPDGPTASEAQVRSRWADAEEDDPAAGVWLLPLSYAEFVDSQLGEPTRLPDGTPVWLDVPMP